MKILVKYLKLYLIGGYVPVASCCGHGKYPSTLLIKSNGVVIDFFSGNIIPRKRNFYKKDKQGYYFIPETLKQTKGKHK